MKLFVQSDLDGFFGLFIDNLVQVLLIVALCGTLCGMTGDQAYLLYSRILPGVAVSILFGNVFYAWQAHRLARREGRDDVTALPYGINTTSLIIFIPFVMVPVYQRTNSAEAAWQMGLFACLGSGLIELAGAFVAEKVRRHTPRAALLSTLAGIAIGFIAMPFTLKIWSQPVIAFVPLAIVLVTYFGHIRLPLRLPGGLVAVAVGSLLAWTLPEAWTGCRTSAASVRESLSQAGAQLPSWSGGALAVVLQLPPRQWLGFLSIIVPMGLINVIGSLQNIESAEAGGDRYDTRMSLSVNGVGTILAALFGSCFPTTIYIGHPGWKALGARAGYSTLNGFVITILCLTGTIAVVNKVIPISAGMPIVLWIGVVITAQAFQATPANHAPAVAVGLFPAIAAWGATLVAGAFATAQGVTLQSLLAADPSAETSGYLIHGLIVLERGYIFTCMVLAAIAVFLIEHRFFTGAVWALVGLILTLLGLAHAYQVSGNRIDHFLVAVAPAQGTVPYRAYDVAAGYAAIATVLGLTGLYVSHRRDRTA